MSGNSLRGRCLQRSVSVSKSPEDPWGFCRRSIGNEALNNNPDNFFTHDIATNESPGVKSTSCQADVTFYCVDSKLQVGMTTKRN